MATTLNTEVNDARSPGESVKMTLIAIEVFAA